MYTLKTLLFENVHNRKTNTRTTILKDLEEFIRMEEIEGMEAVGTGLAVVVEVNDDEFNVVGFGRETPAEASEEALDGGAPAGTEFT